eukprot:2130769-Rhodomonas_salina.1
MRSYSCAATGKLCWLASSTTSAKTIVHSCSSTRSRSRESLQTEPGHSLLSLPLPAGRRRQCRRMPSCPLTFRLESSKGDTGT